MELGCLAGISDQLKSSQRPSVAGVAGVVSRLRQQKSSDPMSLEE